LGTSFERNPAGAVGRLLAGGGPGSIEPIPNCATGSDGMVPLRLSGFSLLVEVQFTNPSLDFIYNMPRSTKTKIKNTIGLTIRTIFPNCSDEFICYNFNLNYIHNMVYYLF
jgi:hypothetical protein